MTAATPPNRGTIFTGEFWAETADRAIKSAAAGLVAKVGDNYLGLYDLGWDLTWKLVVAYTIISVAFSVISAPIHKRGTPNLL